MKNLMNYPFDWIIKTSEATAELFQNGSEAWKKDFRTLRFKNETYWALCSLWNQLYMIDRRLSDKKDIEQDLGRALENFNQDIREIFDRMEDGPKIYFGGGMESFFDLFLKEIHAFLGSGTKRLKNLQSELNDFWNDFFNLDRPEGNPNQELDAFLTKFEMRIQEILTPPPVIKKEGGKVG